MDLKENGNVKEVSKPQFRTIEFIQSEEKRKKNSESLWGLGYNSKRPNICVIESQKEESDWNRKSNFSNNV